MANFMFDPLAGGEFKIRPETFWLLFGLFKK
jgi:hypothetical protein